jgi:hypothetical protein
VDKSCWLCGIRLYPGQLVADGGSACADVRWYCLDMRACTERWTSRLAGQADLREGSTGTPEAQGGQPAPSGTAWSARSDAAWPARV